METGYEIEPRPIGRSSRRRLPVVVAAVAVVLGIVIAKPWTGGPLAPSVGPVASSAVAAASLNVATSPAPGAAAQAAATWPASPSAAETDVASAARAEAVLGALADRSGAWGVGGAGSGPRILRDEPWTDWAAVVPEAAGDTPANLGIWPGTGLCTGFPVINDRPSLIAVTAPADLVPDWRLVGWWTNGSRFADLEGSIKQVSPAGNRGISYLERTDRAPWPIGRYEFHVIAGSSTVALTVCLDRFG